MTKNHVKFVPKTSNFNLVHRFQMSKMGEKNPTHFMKQAQE